VLHVLAPVFQRSQNYYQKFQLDLFSACFKKFLSVSHYSMNGVARRWIHRTDKGMDTGSSKAVEAMGTGAIEEYTQQCLECG
jgi:hypothetical protein